MYCEGYVKNNVGRDRRPDGVILECLVSQWEGGEVGKVGRWQDNEVGEWKRWEVSEVGR